MPTVTDRRHEWRGIVHVVSAVITVGVLLSGIVNGRLDLIVLAAVTAVLIAVNVSQEADNG